LTPGFDDFFEFAQGHRDVLAQQDAREAGMKKLGEKTVVGGGFNPEGEKRSGYGRTQ